MRRPRPCQGVTRAEILRLKRIAAGDAGPGSAKVVRAFRKKLERQLPRPLQPQRRQVRAEAAPWIAGEPAQGLRETEIDRAAARAFARSPAAQGARPALQPLPAARISRRTCPMLRSVAVRLERLERQARAKTCSRCTGRLTVVPCTENGQPPRGIGCPCGAVTIIWLSQAPASLDEALRRAGARERPTCSIPLSSGPATAA